VTILPAAKRLDDNEARARFDPVNPTPSPFANRLPPTPIPGVLTANQVNEQLDAFLVEHHAAVRVNDGGREHGQIRAFNNRTFDVAKTVPTVILRNEDYGRIWRLLADGRTVDLDVDVVNHVYPEGATVYNTVGEIAGGDKAEDVVMLGAHLDSWHAATGATDNAIGCAIMLEAARILQAVGAKPRRTIRVALWSGEEEGLLGSIAYVQDHFGMAETPKAEHAKLDAYWNIDDGTGRVRGASIFGPREAAAILAQFFKPFEDWGVYGASATSSRATGGTDSTSFNQAGLPGIGTQQDQIEYNSTTWHTNLDTYERIVPDDVMKNAVITASVVLHIANREQMIPRFAAADMPALPPARGGGAGVGRGNTGPVADSHIYAAAKNKPLTKAAPGLLPPATPATAGGPPAAVRTAALGTGAAHGTVALKGDGSFVYTPSKDYTGDDAFTYTVTSGGATSAAATVTIVVR
jgi:hypothetical protein